VGKTVEGVPEVLIETVGFAVAVRFNDDVVFNNAVEFSDAVKFNDAVGGKPVTVEVTVIVRGRPEGTTVAIGPSTLGSTMAVTWAAIRPRPTADLAGKCILAKKGWIHRITWISDESNRYNSDQEERLAP